MDRRDACPTKGFMKKSTFFTLPIEAIGGKHVW